MDVIKHREQELKDAQHALQREKEQVALDLAKNIEFPTERLKEWFRTRVEKIRIPDFATYQTMLPVAGQFEMFRVNLSDCRVISAQRVTGTDLISTCNTFYISGVSVEFVGTFYNMKGADREFIMSMLPIKTDMDFAIWIASFEMFIMAYLGYVDPNWKTFMSRFIHRCFC
jgi:hypothetical protein